jgi:hypothetical protein
VRSADRPFISKADLVGEADLAALSDRRIGHANPAVTLTVDGHVFARGEQDPAAVPAIEAAMGAKR